MSDFRMLHTPQGENLLAKVHAGAVMQLTRVVLGNGIWTEAELASRDLAALKSECMSLAITDVSQSGDEAVVTAMLDNAALESGFSCTEMGIYARPEGGEELLYMAGYLEPAKSSFVHSKNGTPMLIPVTVTIVVAGSGEVEIAFKSDYFYVTKAELARHATDSQTHADIRSSLEEHVEDDGDPHGTLPAGGEPGQVIIKQEDGSLAWGTVAGMPVGTLHFPSTGKPDAGSVAVNVKQKFLRTVYPQLVSRVLADGEYLTTEESWDAKAVMNEGSCALYALTDTHIILPCYRHYWAAAQPEMAGKEVGDWQGDAIRNIAGETVSATSAGIVDTSSTQTGPFTKGTASSTRVDLASISSFRLAFDASLCVPTSDENRPKTVYVLPCIKAADVATNASQVDMLALANQVTQINGDKVDKGDAEYRSIVELKGSRGAVGTWTIADLIVGKPLFVSLTDTSDDGVLYRVVSGTLDAVTTSTSRYHGMASRANFTSVTPSSFTLIPTASVVEIYIQSIQSGATLRAYQ